MNRPGRLSLFRRMALALVAAQALAYALSPVVESGAAQRAEAGIERSHSGCSIVHRPDTCIACQLMAVRARAPHAGDTDLPGGGRVLAENAPRTTNHAPRTPPRAGLHSRAPPASLA